ncbi:MAG: hypothetical protein NTX22_06525 [Ignavibacteriales bacterium]|nr:hypothetical protein [Ignavibacteriales bacterium]
MKKIILLIIPLFYFGCDKIPSGVVDSKPINFQAYKIIAPEIFVYNQNDSSFTTSVKMNYSDNIRQVWLDYYSSDGKKINSNPINLVDSGNLSEGDSTGGDNVFSVKLSLSKYDPNGKYLIEYFITDNLNHYTKIGEHNLVYFNNQQNYPPIISNLSAPDSIQLTNQEVIITLSLLVVDYNGLSDVKTAFFNSYIPPDGRPSQSNPIIMYDDGSHGDIASSDGLFTTQVRLPATGVTKGIYRWEFQAKDRSDSLSNIIIHNLLIK